VDISINKKNQIEIIKNPKTITPPTPVPSPDEKGGGLFSYVL
jgi:hypothetical protein